MHSGVYLAGGGRKETRDQLMTSIAVIALRMTLRAPWHGPDNAWRAGTGPFVPRAMSL